MRTRQRVLLLSGPAVGGMRRHVESLAAGLPERGFEAAVAAPGAMELGPRTARFCLELGDRPRPASDLGTLRALRRAVREWRPGLGHAHGGEGAVPAPGAALPGPPPGVVPVPKPLPRGP